MEYDRLNQEAEYQNALNAYSQTVARKDNLQQENDKEADKYNSIISGIAEPVGTALIHKPVAKLLKKAVQKGLKKGIGRVVRTGREVASDLREGTNPLGTIGRNINEGLGDLRSGVTSTVNDLSGLSNDGLAQLNSLRGSRPPIRASIDDRPPPPGIEDRPTGNLDDPVPGAVEPTEVNLADEANRDDDLVDAVMRGEMTPEQAGAHVSMRDQADGPRLPGQPESADAQGERFRDRQNQLDQNQPDTTNRPASDEPAPEPAPEPNDGTDAPTPPAGDDDVPSAPVPAAADDALPATLGTAAEDVEIAGGGPEDPFTDILSAILGIGSLVAGAVDPVKPQAAVSPITNPSVQYGI